VKGRETVKFVTSGTKYKAIPTINIPTINNNAIIQIVTLSFM